MILSLAAIARLILMGIVYGFELLLEAFSLRIDWWQLSVLRADILFLRQ